ncbi:MAG: hypothetical protein RLZZ468_226 [Cyanobacteriota bacterium]|jgi:hypothetical protein
MAHAMPPALRRFDEFLAANPSPTDVVAGRFYWVPCATHPDGKRWPDFRHEGGGVIAHVPLIGTVHEDRDIVGFTPWHIHVDTRFITIPSHQYPGDQESADATALARPLSLTAYWDPDKTLHWAAAVLSLRRIRARRSEPPEWSSRLVRWIPALEDAYADASAACGVCPHRQIPLSAGRDMGNGVRQCPGHGLCWDGEGRLVRRGVAT